MTETTKTGSTLREGDDVDNLLVMRPQTQRQHPPLHLGTHHISVSTSSLTPAYPPIPHETKHDCGGPCVPFQRLDRFRTT